MLSPKEIERHLSSSYVEAINFLTGHTGKTRSAIHEFVCSHSIDYVELKNMYKILGRLPTHTECANIVRGVLFSEKGSFEVWARE